MDNAGQWFTWEALSTMGGASLLTFFIVQYAKSYLDHLTPRIPTDLAAVGVAWMILIVSQLAEHANAADWRLYALSLANAFLVAAASGQMQRKAVSPPGGLRSQETDQATETRKSDKDD